VTASASSSKGMLIWAIAVVITFLPVWYFFLRPIDYRFYSTLARRMDKYSTRFTIHIAILILLQTNGDGSHTLTLKLIFPYKANISK